MGPDNSSLAFAVLAFLGTAFLAAVGSLFAAWRALRDDVRGAGRALGGVCLLLAGYGIALTAGGLLGKEQVIEAGGEKYFCELDCHLAYSVAGFEAVGVDTGGGPRLWQVTLRTRFDEKTISPKRPPGAPTWPAPRRVALVDAEGRASGALPPEDARAAKRTAGSIPLTQPLRPGESYATLLLFELPGGAVPSRLLVQDDLVITRFLIGYERSPFHRPILLALPRS